MKKIFIRVERDDIIPNSWMITVQAEGYPKSVAFLDDKLEGLQGTKKGLMELAEKVRQDTQDANPNYSVVVVK